MKWLANWTETNKQPKKDYKGLIQSVCCLCHYSGKSIWWKCKQKWSSQHEGRVWDIITKISRGEKACKYLYIDVLNSQPQFNWNNNDSGAALNPQLLPFMLINDQWTIMKNPDIFEPVRNRFWCSLRYFSVPTSSANANQKKDSWRCAVFRGAFKRVKSTELFGLKAPVVTHVYTCIFLELFFFNVIWPPVCKIYGCANLFVNIKHCKLIYLLNLCYLTDVSIITVHSIRNNCIHAHSCSYLNPCNQPTVKLQSNSKQNIADTC